MLSTEDKILHAAYKIFLLFGYHGTTIQQIAMQAGVNKSAVHYYFRSKDRLYVIIVKKVLDRIINNNIGIIDQGYVEENPTWFLFTERYNNNNLFEKTLKDLYPHDWDKILYEINKRIEFASIF